MIDVKPYFEDVMDSLSEMNLSKKRNRTKENPKGDSWFTLLMNQRDQHKFERTLYGAKEVKDRLIEIFQNKCAFCECDTSAGAAYDVEHFRPKFLYYWLCYEWTNLLLSCRTCNEIYKRTHFPLENEMDRLQNHPITFKATFDKSACHILSDTLKIEQPYLLHPAIDNPRVHLRFLNDGTVEGLTPKGSASIVIYGLNRRRLVEMRSGLILEIQKDILQEFYMNPTPSEKRIKIEIYKSMSKLVKQITDNQTFKSFRTCILEDFDAFVIRNKDINDDFDALPHKEIMSAATKEYYENKLFI